MRNYKIYVALCLVVLLAPLPAQDSNPDKRLNDSLLDKLVGDWNVERNFPSGRTAMNFVHVEWVLQHQFVELHYKDVAAPPQYEALVLIGYDGIAKHYICHSADVFGAGYSTDGFAPRDAASKAIEFKFSFHDGELKNRFTFDPASGAWSSTIRQTQKGKWKLFCEDKFTRAVAKP